MGPADIVDPAVAGDIGHHLDADALEVFADQPDLPGQVEVAEDIDAVFGDAAGIAGADQLPHGRAGGLVALALVALEAFRHHRQDGDALFLGNAPAYRRQVVADQADDAGRVDEGRLRGMPVDQFDQGLIQLGFAAEDDVHLLQIGGKGQAVQFGTGRQGAADIPGIDGAADGAVHQVHGIGDRVEHDPGTAEHAGPLADCPGEAVLVAFHREGRRALAMDLAFSAMENGSCVHKTPLSIGCE